MDPTESVRLEVDRLLANWQDSTAFLSLHAMVQANLVSAILHLGNGNLRPPPPDVLRQEAADVRYSADGFATFLERLADRIAAANN